MPIMTGDNDRSVTLNKFVKTEHINRKRKLLTHNQFKRIYIYKYYLNKIDDYNNRIYKFYRQTVKLPLHSQKRIQQ